MYQLTHSEILWPHRQMVGARYLKHLRQVIHGFYKVKKKGMVPVSVRVTASTLPFSSGGSPAVCVGAQSVF